MSARRKQFTNLAKPVLRQSAKTPTKSRIDETRTTVSAGLSAPKTATDPIEISSDSSSHYSDSDNEEGDSDIEVEATPKPTHPLKESRASRQKTTPPEISKLKQSQDDQDEDVEMGSPKPQDGPEQGEGSDAELTSPTFGDLVRGTSTIDVTSTLAAQASGAVARRPDAAAQRPAALTNSTSLGTVLNQALKSDDSDLLESCLQVNDHTIIQNTINRMDSALAAVLLSKLAARMHRRPGRAFGLMKWMQMTLITHGGSLVTQPDLVKRLGELSRVLEERSRGLPSLLSLKGKLDMLDAQMKFRKSIKDSKRDHQDKSDEESEEDEDEPGVVYVEGQESHAIKALTNGTGGASRNNEDDDFLVANGINEDSDDESFDEDGDDVVEELADVESLDEDEVDHDDVEESGEDDDDEEAPPPAKLQKTSSKFAKRK